MRLWRTLAVLAALAAALAALLVFQREEEREAAHAFDVALLPDLEPGRVAAIEIQHLANATHVALERDAAGTWYVVDPVAYPADAAVVEEVLAALARSRGVAARGVSAEAAGLDPPLIVARVEVAGGEARRVEVGRAVAAGGRVHAREATGGAAGPVLLVPARIETALERFPDDFRERRITELDAREVVAFRRRGSAVLEEGGPPVDLALDAALEETGWRSLEPVRARLDPLVAGLLVRAAAELRAAEFTDDAPADLARYGLDAPALEVEIEDARGRTAHLRFGQPGPAPAAAHLDPWLATRAGASEVWRVRRGDVALLARPLEQVLDPLVFRVGRGDVARVELVSGARELVLARDGQGGWRAGARRATDPEDEPEWHPAEGRAVGDLLGRIEHAEVREDRPDLAFPVFVTRPDSIALVTRGGARTGGELAPAPEEIGADAALFRRFGDELVLVVDAELAELARTPLEALVSRELLALPEHEVEAVSLSGPGADSGAHSRDRTEVVFERDPASGLWRERGREGEARGFALAVDRLLGLRVDRILAAPDADAVRDGIEARVSGTFGPERRVLLGRLPDGTEVAVADGRRAGEVDPALRAALADVLRAHASGSGKR